MHPRQWIINALISTLLLAAAPVSASEVNLAAIDFGVQRDGTAGVMTCLEMGRKLRSEWLSLKDLLAPQYKGKRPKRDAFQCVDARYTQGMVETGATLGSGLRCFRSTEVNGRGLCCDNNLTVCGYYYGE